MRRGVFVSSLLIAGSALCAPAFAQTQEKPAEAPVAPAEAPAPAKLEAPVVKPKPKPARPDPLLATPNGQVMDRARELAEADLAAAPDEEVKPLQVDPNLARKRDFALPKPVPKPAVEEEAVLAERPSAAQPAVAEAKNEPKRVAKARPALAGVETPAPVAETRPAVAERDAASEPARERDPVVKPVYAQRRYESDAENDPVSEADDGDPVVRPTYRQRRWEPRQIEQAARAPSAAPKAAAAEGRPDYVEAERIVREVNSRADGEPLPAVEAGRMAEVAPPAAEPVVAEAAAPVAETTEIADAAPVARQVQSAKAAAVDEAPQVADAAEEAGESARDVLRDASRATRVIRQAGRVAKALGGAAVGAAADAPVLAGDEDEREARPVYAEEEREEAPVYAEDERETDRGNDRALRREEPVYADVARDGRDAPVYAEERRAYPPVYERPYRQQVGYPERWTSRVGPDSCDSHRYEGLARAVRRAAAVGSIDWQTARDMEEEIAHGESMQRSYCESGMNDWRERRLDDQYAQIEDRLRYERRRFR